MPPKKGTNVVVEVPACPICAEPYTSHLRKKVECNGCHKECCIKCVEQYMLSSIEDPHCMHCRAAWTRSFLNTICSATFLNKTYYAHRQTILVNREKSFLPGYQLAAERELKVRDLKKEEGELNKSYAEIEKEFYAKLSIIQKQRGSIQRRIYNVQMGRPETGEGGSNSASAPAPVAAKFVRRCTAPDCNGFLSSVWKCGICHVWVCPDCFEVKGLDKDSPHTCTADNLATAALLRKDTKPCPTCGEMISKIDGCFAGDTPIRYLDGHVGLSQNVKVGDELLGEDGKGRKVISVCSGMDEMYRVIQSNGINYTVNSKHILALKNEKNGKIEEIDTDIYVKLMSEVRDQLKGYNIDSSRLVSSLRVEAIGIGQYHGFSVDTHGETVSRRFALEDGTIVRNCDQMWCTACHSPFSWTTGQAIKTGTVHNPHYFAWLAKGGQHTAAHPGFVPCGGFPNPYHVQSAFEKLSKSERSDLLQILRICLHMTDVERHRYERHLNPVNNEDMGVKYLLKEANEEDWKAVLGRREKERLKSNEIRDILDGFNGAAIDLFRRIDVAKKYTREEALDLITSLRLELDALRQFTFQAMSDVSKIFNCSVPFINEKWEVGHGKVSDLARKAKAAEEAAAKKALEAAAAASGIANVAANV